MTINKFILSIFRVGPAFLIKKSLNKAMHNNQLKFSLKNLKLYFLYFLSANLIVTMGAISFRGMLNEPLAKVLNDRFYSWALFLVIVLITYLNSKRSKAALRNILELSAETQFSAYEKYFKQRIVWNFVSVVITAFMLMATAKKAFFYLLLIQATLSLLFYPQKRVIALELKNPDIVFD